MRNSPARLAILKRLRFAANTLAISTSLLATITALCLNHETRSAGSAALALGFFACFAALWSFVREDIAEREALGSTEH